MVCYTGSWGTQVFGGEKRRKRQLEDLDLDGRTILESILGSYDGHMDYIQLAEGGQWRNVVNTVMNFRF